MMPYRADRVDVVCRFYIGVRLNTKAVSTLCNCQSIASVALRKYQQLLAGCFCDVALRLCDRDGELCSESLHQCFAHNAHKGGVSRGAALARLEYLIDNDAEVKLLVAILAERAVVVRSIPTVFAALKMVDMQFDWLLVRALDSAAGAGVVISPEDVLTNIIRTVHFALLIVLALWDRLSVLNSFEELKVEFCSLNDHFVTGRIVHTLLIEVICS